MEELKILFADLHKLQIAAKDEVRDIGKMVEALLPGGEWEQVSAGVNSVISEAMFLQKLAQAMIENADQFLQRGPYTGEMAGITPLESAARGN